MFPLTIRLSYMMLPYGGLGAGKEPYNYKINKPKGSSFCSLLLSVFLSLLHSSGLRRVGIRLASFWTRLHHAGRHIALGEGLHESQKITNRFTFS